jgi:mitogen-activated protein kinase kinase
MLTTVHGQAIPASSTADMEKQISRELKFGKLCNSENICRYYGVFHDEDSSTVNIAIEYCEGGSLEGIYKKVGQLGGRIGERVILTVAEQVLKGLDYLDERKIIHRDIKPSNILLSKVGEVKICDFGVSGDVGPEGEAYTCIGTSYYMAPERMRGEKYTIASDIWSLGITLLEITSSQFPFPDGERLAFFDFLAFIACEAIELKDEPEANVTWSSDFKSFIGSWYVSHYFPYR